MKGWRSWCEHRMARAAFALWVLALLPELSSAQSVPPLALPLAISNKPNCLYEDYAGFVWLCTDRGVVRFDGRRETTFATDRSDLRTILRGSRGGQYWVGGESGLFEMRSNHATPGTVRLERLVTERPFPAVNALVEFIDGSIGCATNDGAFRLANGTVTEIPLGLPDDPAGRIVRVLSEPDVGVLLAGTTSGLYVRSRDGTRHFTTDDGLPENDVQALAVTLGWRIWIGTRKGLATIDLKDLQSHTPRPVRLFSNAEMLRDADIRALRVLNSTSVWVGASTGLVVVTTFASKSPEVTKVAATGVRLFSQSGPDLLVSTDDDVRWVRDGRTGGRTVISSIKVDGRLQPLPFDGSKHVRLELPWRSRLVEIGFIQPRNEMMFRFSGLSNYLIRTGVVSDREGTFSDIPEPWTMFRSAEDGQIRGDLFIPLSRDSKASLFAIPTPRDTAPIVLRQHQDQGPPTSFASKYIATADTTGWLRVPEGTERRIVIEHPAQTLASGLHRVVVFARNGTSIQGDSASVEFAVPVAPWVRWWFIGPVLLTIAATGVIYSRHRHRREADLASLRSRIAADLHDSVGASLSRIAILSDVVAKQVGEQVPTAGSSLKAIGDNARSVIDEISDAVWFIDPAIHDVGDMLVRIRTVAAQLFEPDQVAWSVDADEGVSNLPLTSEQRRHIYLFIKEALTNVRRHTEPSFVAVRFAMGAAGLRVEIDDDGRAVMPTTADRRGNGIANMRTRAAELGGTLVVEPRAPAPGTRVAVQTNLR